MAAQSSEAKKCRRWLTPADKTPEKEKERRPLTTGLLQADLERIFENFMDPTVRELPKSEEIVLPDIRFLTQDELDALRANAEALKKKFDQTTR
jgi:hypothetical protein